MNTLMGSCEERHNQAVSKLKCNSAHLIFKHVLFSLFSAAHETDFSTLCNFGDSSNEMLIFF